jgi:hypothetical protein
MRDFRVSGFEIRRLTNYFLLDEIFSIRALKAGLRAISLLWSYGWTRVVQQ